jgi:ABC-type phosphate/phosphonate transport system substrate-binding protein
VKAQFPNYQYPKHLFREGVMKKLKKCFVGVMVCLMMGLWALCGAVNAAGTYTMAIMPGHMASVTTYSAFVPLVNEIEQKAGIELKVVVPEDPDALLDLVKKGQVDFIYADAPVYLSIKEYINKDYLLISLTPDMHRTHQAAIIVRKDSKIDSLNDLKGKTFLFGPRFAASKGMAAMALLKKSGIDIDKRTWTVTSLMVNVKTLPCALTWKGWMPVRYVSMSG